MNEITLSGSLAYEDDAGAADSLEQAEVQATSSGKRYLRAKQNIGTSEEAIGLGSLATLGWAMFKNLDYTNFLEIRMASGSGNDHIKVPPRKSAGPFHFGSDVSAPYAIANTAACELDYLIVEQ